MSKLARLILRRATHERMITRIGQSIGAKPRKCAALHVAGNNARSWFDWLTMSGLRRRMWFDWLTMSGLRRRTWFDWLAMSGLRRRMEMIEGFRFTRHSWLPPPSVRVSMAQVRV